MQYQTKKKSSLECSFIMALVFSFLIGTPSGVLALEENKPQASPEQKQEKSGSHSKPIRDKWAVVIGIDNFKDKSIPKLRYSAKDARDFAQFLVDKGNFAQDHVKLILNERATEDNILDTLGGNWLPRRVLPDDLVVIYVSSHGSPKELDHAGVNYLVAHDTVKNKLYASGIRLSDLGPGIQERTGCSRVVLLLDACNSGAAKTESKGLYRNMNFDLDSLYKKAGEGLVVISSSSQNQRSWESKRYKNGVFTRNLITALSKPEDKKLEDVFADLKDNVEQEVRFDRKMLQTPVMKSKWQGDPLDITAKPIRPRTVEKIQAEEETLLAESEPAEQKKEQIKASLVMAASSPPKKGPWDMSSYKSPQNLVANQEVGRVDKVAMVKTPPVAPPIKSTPSKATKTSSPVAKKKKVAIIGILPPQRPGRNFRNRNRKIARAKEMNFPMKFRNMLADQLRVQPGVEMVPHEAVQANFKSVYLGKKPNFFFPNRVKLSSLGKALHSDYLVMVQIGQMKINEQNRFGAMYNINMTAKVFEAGTGKQKAVVKKFAIRPANKKGSPKEIVSKVVLPSLANELASEIARKI